MEYGNTLMTPTVEWMSKNYDKYNKELFYGELGQCDFAVRQMGTSILGNFKFQNRIKYNNGDYLIYKEDFYGRRVYANHDNFYSLCKPVITMNSGYSATEEALLSTLIHEMCHYYNYCYGEAPKQGHGKEFRRIADIVSARSNGRFDVERFIKISNFTPDDDLKEKIRQKKEKRERRENNQLTRLKAYIWIKNGETRLTTASPNSPMIDEWFDSIKKRVFNKIDEIYIVDDINFNIILKQNGMFSSLRTLKYWNITDEPWAKNIKDEYNTREIYNKEDGFVNEGRNRLIRIIEKEVRRKLTLLPR